MPLGEIFTVDEAIERMISTGAPTADIRRQLSGRADFATLAHDALRHAARGEVSLEDVYRATSL